MSALGSRPAPGIRARATVADWPQAEIGVFGGTGFYAFLEGAAEHRVETPYGDPSDAVTIADVGGRRVAFLPRHGRGHTIPAHRVPYRPNIWAMHSLGVRRIIAPCAAGALDKDLHPGDFVLCDQFVDRTSGRTDSFYDGPEVVHVSAADPYCPELRRLALTEIGAQGLRVRGDGTVVVIQGPRFSTRAESHWFGSQGWHVVNMTQYPEVILAREMGMCYLNISLVTDYDAAVEGHPKDRPVGVGDVMRVLSENVERVRDVIVGMIPQFPATPGCSCSAALDQARV